MERDGRGLYGFTEEPWERQARENMRLGKSTNETNPTTRPGHAASVVLNQPVSLNQPATEPSLNSGTDRPVSPANTIGRPIHADFVRRWDPDSFGTQYRNGTLTIAVNGLSLEKRWCDPDRVPPWALERAESLLDPQLLLGPKNADDNLVVSRAQIIELNQDVGELPQQLGPMKLKRKEHKDEPIKGNNEINRKAREEEVSPDRDCSKKTRVSYSPRRGGSMKIPNRGGRGLLGRLARGRGHGSTKGKKNAIFPPKDICSESLCEVVVSPSKELEQVEKRQRICVTGNFNDEKGCGGWPKTSTRKS